MMRPPSERNLLLLALYAQGQSYGQIAAQLGISRARVQKLVKKYGAPPREPQEPAPALVPVTLGLPAGLHAQLAARAQESGRPLAAEVREAVIAGLEEGGNNELQFAGAMRQGKC